MPARAQNSAESIAIRSALIIEDQALVARSFQRVLKLAGVDDVRIASSAAEATVEVEANPPGMLLVDINLGDGPDGLLFLRERRDKGYTGLAVVMSGDTSSEQFFRAAWAGANDYLVKDGVKNLSAELRRIISRRTNYSEVEWRHKAVLELGYLRSWKLRQRHIDLLEHWVALGFPRYQELAKLVGLSYAYVKECFAQVFDLLGITNLAQLVDILRTCTMFEQRWGTCVST